MSSTVLFIIVIIILVAIFTNLLDSQKKWISDALSESAKPEKMAGDNGEGVIDTTVLDEIQNRRTQVEDTGDKVYIGGGVTSDILDTMGYGEGGIDWVDYIKAENLDPSAFVNQANYAKTAKRFSSGANFTAVQDDNNSPFFTNFIGLRRPQHVPIGDTARQVPDVDESVLARNRDFRW